MNCVYCGTPFEAKRATAKYCKPAHRVAMAQNGPPKVTPLPTAQGGFPQGPVSVASSVLQSSLVEAVTAELDAAERLNTSLGQQAVYLAGRIVSASFDTGSSIASMNRELRETMARALDGVVVKKTLVDELRDRRDAKRLSG